MSETMLDLRGVSKSFGHKAVLNEVDLILPAGSVLGLVGKNGAGKTTLLKCALGLQRPKIVYNGELDALKDSVKRLRVQAAAPLPNGSFRVPGMLHAKVTGNEAVVSVQDFTVDLPERIAQQWSASVAVQDLNLEDIFLELHHE